jgi:succinate dehydrogenase/fumarate reductase flavoprotein subunit
MSWPYDYIIIGAGSAGCAIANRLAEDLALRILIIEAGPPDTSFKLRMPAGFASLGDKSPYNWRYETTPQKHCNDRRMYWPRGKNWGVVHINARRWCAAMPRTTTMVSARQRGSSYGCCLCKKPSTTSADLRLSASTGLNVAEQAAPKS